MVAVVVVGGRGRRGWQWKHGDRTVEHTVDHILIDRSSQMHRAASNLTVQCY